MRWTRVWAVALALLIGLGAFTIPQTAEAGRGWGGPGWRGHGYYGPRRGYWGGPGYVGAGLIGLGVGAAIGSALAAPVYVGPAPVYAAPPPVGYAPYPYGPEAYGPEAYGPDAYGPEGYGPDDYAPEAYAPGPAGVAPGPQDRIAYCSQRYRSFNPRTGMYTGYDGVQRPCQ